MCFFSKINHFFFLPPASRVHQKQQMARVESERTATLSYTWQTPHAQRSNSPPGPISLRPRGQFVGSVWVQISKALPTASVSAAVEAGATKSEMKEARKSEGWKKYFFFLRQSILMGSLFLPAHQARSSQFFSSAALEGRGGGSEWVREGLVALGPIRSHREKTHRIYKGWHPLSDSLLRPSLWRASWQTRVCQRRNEDEIGKKNEHTQIPAKLYWVSCCCFQKKRRRDRGWRGLEGGAS